MSLIYLHEKESETLVVEDAMRILKKTLRSTREVVLRPVCLKFIPLGKKKWRPVPEGIPFKNSLARGILDVDAEIERIRMEGNGLYDDDDNDITDEHIRLFMQKHVMRDRDFIELDGNGNWAPRPDVKRGGQTFFCAICEQPLLSAHALQMHEMSPPHMKRELELRDEELGTNAENADLDAPIRRRVQKKPAKKSAEVSA